MAASPGSVCARTLLNTRMRSHAHVRPANRSVRHIRGELVALLGTSLLPQLFSTESVALRDVAVA
eukprot:COSAG02_NODE_6478_length_3548_cov_1.346477_2_plen_65_part_00